MKKSFIILQLVTLLFLSNCSRNNDQNKKMSFNEPACIRFIAETPFDSLSIVSRDCSFFPITACLPQRTVITQKGDYYASFRISKPEMFNILINDGFFAYVSPGDTLVIKIVKNVGESKINVKIEDPTFTFLQNEYRRFGSYFFQSPLTAKYYNSKPTSQKELELALSAIDSVTNARLEFLEQNFNKLPSWFFSLQKADYQYMAAHLKYFQHFLFNNNYLKGTYPSINIKINNPNAILSSYYYCFLNDYFLLTYFDNKDSSSGPSRAIDLYNKASINIESSLNDEILKYFQCYLFVTLYNASMSKKDIEAVDEFARSKNFNFSELEISYINYEKSEVLKKLKII